MKLTIKETSGKYIAACEDIECLAMLAESVGLKEQLYVAEEELGCGLLKGLNKMQAELLEAAFKGRHRRAEVAWRSQPVEEVKSYIGLKINEEDVQICTLLNRWIEFSGDEADLVRECKLSELVAEEGIESYIIASCDEHGGAIDYYAFNNNEWVHLNKKVIMTDPPLVKAKPYIKPKVPKVVEDVSNNGKDVAASVVNKPVNDANKFDNPIVNNVLNAIVNKEEASTEIEIPEATKGSQLWDLFNKI